MAIFAAFRRVHHAGDVSAGGQHEPLGAAQQRRAAVGAGPGRDMVLPRGQEVGRHVDPPEVDGVAQQGQAAGFAQQVLLIHLAQVEAVHTRRHPGAVAVPIQQVERERLVAHQVVVDHERPDQVVGTQHAEGHRHVGAVQIAARLHAFLQRTQLLLVDEHAEFPGLLEVQHGGEERGGPDARVARRCHPRQGAGEQRAAQAIADGVHLLLARRLPDGVQRSQDAVLHVVLKPLAGQAFVRVHPAHHEHGVALADRPPDEAVLGAEVQDVELVDPGRHYQQRPLQHLVRAGRILDQLHHLVLEHYLARRDRDIAAELEGGLVRVAYRQPAAPAFQVAQQVRQAAQQVLAAGFSRAPQYLRIGQQEVCRAHGIDELAGVEIHLLRRGRVQPVHLRHHVVHEARGQQIGLLDEVEDLAALPGFVVEPPVLRPGGDHRPGIQAPHAAGGVLPQRHVILPEADAGTHHLGRVAHQLRRHRHEGAADVQRVDARCLVRLTVQPVPDQALRPLGDVSHRPAEHGGVRQAQAGRQERR